MIAALTIRPLHVADVPALTGVLARAYRSRHSFEPRLRAWLRMTAVATFVAEFAGEPVGMVVGNDYGPLAYVSQMGVDPMVQRRGIGSALMDALIAWADGRSFFAVELDATPFGAPLYAKYGFRAESETLVYEALENGPTIAHEGVEADGDRLAAEETYRRGVRPYAAGDRDALCAVDARAFGADRSDVLQQLIDDAQNVIVVSGSAGDVDGYAIAQPRPELLGPVIARDARIAARLIDTARPYLAPLHRLSVPSDNRAALAIVAGRPYRFGRALGHMVRGTLPPIRRDSLYARINLGQG